MNLCSLFIDLIFVSEKMRFEDSHRFFLQNMMIKGIFNTKEVTEVFAKATELFGADYGTEKIGEFVNAINKQIRPLGMKIKKVY